MQAQDDSSAPSVRIINPSGAMLRLPVPVESVTEAQVAQMQRLLPPSPSRTVAVIADTEVSGPIQEINKIIPFVGILTGLAYIGHSVTVFDGALGRIEEFCREADVLIIDSDTLPHLDREWYAIATRVMARPSIYVHDRKSYTLRPVLPAASR